MYKCSGSDIDLHNYGGCSRRNVAIKLWFKMRAIVGHAAAIEKRALLLRATGLSRIYRAWNMVNESGVSTILLGQCYRRRIEEFKLHDLRSSADVSHPPTFPCPSPPFAFWGKHFLRQNIEFTSIIIYAATREQRRKNFRTSSRLTNVIVSTFFPLFRLIFTDLARLVQ